MGARSIFGEFLNKKALIDCPFFANEAVGAPYRGSARRANVADLEAGVVRQLLALDAHGVQGKVLQVLFH